MKKEDWKNYLMIIASFIVAIISSGTFNLFVQILFIITFLIICYFAFSYLNNKSNTKKIFLIFAIVIEITILFFSIFINNGSFIDFCKRMTSFFVSSQETSNDNIIISDIDFESYFNIIDEKLEYIDQKVESATSNIEKLDYNLAFFTNNLEDFHFNNNINETEVDNIVQEIEQYYREYSNYFPDLRTDIYSLELMYKLFISNELYYYCNILRAFEKFGIDIEVFGLNTNTLFIWDIETLYITYNMQKQNLKNMYLDENAMGQSLFYNDYRVTMQKYSDTFDYGNWSRNYMDDTADAAERKLNKAIDNYYKKFIINFSTK